MAVIMITEVPGADAELLEGLVAAGLPAAMTEAPGFVSHLGGVSSSGVRVIEVWESPEAHRAWVDEHVTPNLPPGVVPGPIEYIDLVLAVPDRRSGATGGAGAATSAADSPTTPMSGVGPQR